MKDLISNCFLCGEHSLHVAGTEETQVMQCINCGYTTTSKLTGTKETNEEFQKLGEDMKNWAVEKQGKIWIPSIITLPVGMIYPIDSKQFIDDNNDVVISSSIENLIKTSDEDAEDTSTPVMKWGFAPMVEIPEEERKNYPNENGGFYEKKIDAENPKIYEEFVIVLSYVNELMKRQSQ